MAIAKMKKITLLAEQAHKEESFEKCSRDAKH